MLFEKDLARAAPAPRPGFDRVPWVLGLSLLCSVLSGCNSERARGEAPASLQLSRERLRGAARDAPESPAPPSLSLAGAGGTRATPPREEVKPQPRTGASPVALERDVEVRAERRARPPRGPRRTLRPEPPQTELPPGANEEFDPGAVADVDYALVAENENAFATLVHEKKRVLPRNCRDWRSFRARGYTPKSALGEHLDGGALIRCGSLEFLARAAPSRVSYVRDALVGAGPATLPAIVASATSKPALHARTVAASRGMTLAQLLPSAELGTSELPGRVAISEPSSETSVILNAEVWGDINGDGVEDLLISVLNSSDDGTYLDLRLVQLTRSSPDAPLTVIGVSQ